MVKKIVWAVAVTLVAATALFFTGFGIGRKTARIEPPTPQVDTITIRDTIVDYKPKEVAIPAGYELVPVGTSDKIAILQDVILEQESQLLAKPTLVEVHDTTYIAVPMSKTTFTDDKTYKCEVLGYGTKMLWHESYQETSYIKVPELYTPKWAFSPVFDALAGKDVLAVGAGFRLDLWQGKWQFSPKAGYGLLYTPEGMRHGFYGGFSASYNLIRK